MAASRLRTVCRARRRAHLRRRFAHASVQACRHGNRPVRRQRRRKDVLLAGFDDVNFAQFVSPGLTTMHQPRTEIGRAAYETLLARVRDPDSPPRTISFSAPLVVRASTGIGQS